MDDGMWTVVKSSVEWLILPLLGSIAYFFRKYIQRVESVEERINKMETRLAVVENNIHHIKKDLDDIKKGVTKILDRLSCLKN